MKDLTGDIGDDTIVAAATPIAPSAIAVIRLSGPKAIQLLCKLTGSENPKHSVIFKCTLDTGRLRDSILAVAFYSPLSYTGQDCVELYVHGSPVIVRDVIDFCIDQGARIAEGGEFTRRAYLNGKLDLSAAEGVNDIIHAQTISQVNAAYSIAEGFLFRQCGQISDIIVSVAAALQAGLDYPEEGVTVPENRDLNAELLCALDFLDKLIDSYRVGKRIGEGVKVVIVGNVNAGKSSLFNALIGDDRAIVDETAGTTRDSIDAAITYKGVMFVLTDTAGLRQTGDHIERKGIDRTLKLIDEADIIVEVRGDDDNTRSYPDAIKVRSRADLGVQPSEGEISVSSVDGAGIDMVKEALYKKASEYGFVPKSEVVTNIRHYNALLDCRKALAELIDNYSDITEDLKTLYLRDALDALSKITGVVGSDKILDEIFSNFCVGK